MAESSPSGGAEQTGQNPGEENEGPGAEGGSSEGEGQQRQQTEKPSTAEWVVGIFCALVVLAAVGYLFFEALTRPSLPPMVAVQVERVVPMRSGFLVEFRAINEGSSTAANLMVEGTLLQDTTTVEKSTATIDFVPAETEREGGLFFSRDPGAYRLEVRPTGYDRP